MNDMASHAATPPRPSPSGDDTAALQHRQWNSARLLSRGLGGIEAILAGGQIERTPWLAVAFAGGITAWFALPTLWHWLALVTAMAGLATIVFLAAGWGQRFPYLRQSLVFAFLAIAAGCLTVWARSEIVGALPIERPIVGIFEGKVISAEEQSALGRTRLVIATREPQSGRAIRVRINLDRSLGTLDTHPGGIIRIRARLMPPAPPMLPGGYDFARSAWFSGLAATGTALGPAVQVAQPESTVTLGDLRAWLSATSMKQLPDSRGGVAAALLTGDRGGISESDAQAMRDAGLAHLLSISGLHVSAVIGAAYLIALRLLALWPWLALRVRLPVVAAGMGALAGIGYTLLTGSEVPTVRSCFAALLVLTAVALGREALSLRMLALAALFVMTLWPEAVIGPSFQMSFGAVLAIVALSGSDPVRRWFQPREEGWGAKIARHLGMILLTGVVIELTLMPIGFFHFHRAGAYGAMANVIAIPLTTIVVMPALALAVIFDQIGAGGPFWWIAGKALSLMLALAHWVASRPGAVTMIPSMGSGAFFLFLGGGLWLALFKGRARLLGLVPAAFGAIMLTMLRPPDILVSGDGHYVGIVESGGKNLLILRDSQSSFVTDNLREHAGMSGQPQLIRDWENARCSADFCTVLLERGGRQWAVLIARSRDNAPERALAAACGFSDIVIADRRLPRSCQPRWLKADRRMLNQTGGIAIDLANHSIKTVAETQGQHGWWRLPISDRPAPISSALTNLSTATGTPAH